MSKKSMVASLALVTLLTLAFGARSFQASNLSPSGNLVAVAALAASTPQSDCDEIIKNAFANVRKVFTEAQLKQFKAAGFRFGFSCNQGVVTIIGKMPLKANRLKVINAVKKTSGVKKVISTNFRQAGGCAGNEVDCFGDGSVCASSQAQCPVECCGVN